MFSTTETIDRRWWPFEMAVWPESRLAMRQDAASTFTASWRGAALSCRLVSDDGTDNGAQ
jgi:hypothetical protein